MNDVIDEVRLVDVSRYLELAEGRGELSYLACIVHPTTIWKTWIKGEFEKLVGLTDRARLVLAAALLVAEVTKYDLEVKRHNVNMDLKIKADPDPNNFKFANGKWINEGGDWIEVTESGTYLTCIDGVRTSYNTLERAKASFEPINLFKERVASAFCKIDCTKEYAIKQAIIQWCAAHKIMSPFKDSLAPNYKQERIIQAVAYLNYAKYDIDLDYVFEETNK